MVHIYVHGGLGVVSFPDPPRKEERVWEIALLVCVAAEFMECNYVIQANLVAYYNMLYS